MKKFLKVFDYVCVILFSIFFILSCAFISIVPIASDNSYYMQQYKTNGVGPYLTYTLDELELITKSITNYLFKGAASMQIQIDGSNVFSNQAILHMSDVKDLFVGGSILGIISIIITLICLTYIIFRCKSIKHIFRKINYLTFLSFLLIVIAICVYALVDFDSAFVNFHHVIFPDPEKFKNAFFPNDDTLINILTLEFFFDIFFAIIIRLVSLFIIYFIIVQCLYGKVLKKLTWVYKKKIGLDN